MAFGKVLLSIIQGRHSSWEEAVETETPTVFCLQLDFLNIYFKNYVYMTLSERQRECRKLTTHRRQSLSRLVGDTRDGTY